MQVETRFLSDILRGDNATEIYVRLIRIMDEEQPENDEWITHLYPCIKNLISSFLHLPRSTHWILIDSVVLL